MKIAYVANSRIPSRAANTVHVLNMSAGFAELGAEMTLIARGDDEAAASVFDDFDLPTKFELCLQKVRSNWALDRFQFVRRIRRKLQREPFDFVYGRSAYGLLMGVPADIPFAYDVHAYPTSRHHEWIEAQLFSRPNFIFATSITRALADRYVSAYPSLRERVLVAPCAARLPKHVPIPSPARRPGPIRVYYVGHLYEGRGIDMILDLARAEPDLAFHVVGGEEADVARWAPLAAANVKFHGYVKPFELMDHYRNADICIAPHSERVAAAGGGDISRWMSPMKIFEYMAQGKALIAADLPVLREVIETGVDGLLCPPRDIAAWREALRRLAAQPETRARLGEAAFRKVQANHTWEKRAKVVFDRAQGWLAGSPGRSATRPGAPTLEASHVARG